MNIETIVDYNFRDPTHVLSALGLGSPVTRGIAAAVITGGIVFLVKPSAQFLSDGTPKKFSLTPAAMNELDEEGIEQFTLIPFYALPVVVGLGTYLFF